MRRYVGLTALLLFVIAPFGFSDAPLPNPVKPDFNTPRPIDAVDTVFITDMTWMEVRDAMKAGKKTVIIATGGIEQNGPYLVADKHNIVLRGTTEAIARKLGNALVGPIIPFVPEGAIDPADSHMLYPSTVGLTEGTFRLLVSEICTCYRSHGFETIILIGDSGGNQDGMKAVAEQLNSASKDGKTRLYFIPEYYNYAGIGAWLESQGIKQRDEGLHDDFGMTAQMLSLDPKSVRMKERIAAKKFKINGIELAPIEKTIAIGKQIIDYRAEITVKALKEQMKAQK